MPENFAAGYVELVAVVAELATRAGALVVVAIAAVAKRWPQSRW
jgi:hypothetical protein